MGATGGIAEPQTEIAFSRQIAEQKFRGREETLNEQLVKLLAFDTSEATRAVWKREVKNRLSYLAKTRIKGQGAVPERFVWEWLYADPFEENEAPYVNGFVEMHAEDHRRNARSAEAVADAIKRFWREAAPSVAIGRAPRDLVDAL